VVREIKRKTRRKFNPEEKIRIILENWKGEDNITAVCRREGIAPGLYYKLSQVAELSWCITDTRDYYISESTVYPILKANDQVTCLVYTVLSARCKFPNPSKDLYELWQTNFTSFRVVHWCLFYLKQHTGGLLVLHTGLAAL
jgi:hypothetical protein